MQTCPDPKLQNELWLKLSPKEKKFIDLVMEVVPHQVTLVPDAEGQLTSDQGWDTIKHKDYLKEIIFYHTQQGEPADDE